MKPVTLFIRSIAFFTFVIIPFLCFFLLSTILLIQLREGRVGQNSKHHYKYFEKDYSRNEISFGSISLFDELENGSLSFDDYDLQKSVLISSFGTEEYECFGSCYCEEEDIFRRHIRRIELIEGVSYLLGATSSVVAFNVAKEYLQEKCSEEFSNSFCESKSIKSEVSDCEKVFEEGEVPNVGDEHGEPEMRRYFCYGHCVDNLHLGSAGRVVVKYYRPTAKSLGFDCEEIRREGEVEVYSDKLLMTTKFQSLATKMSYTARKTFSKEYMVSFCKENSKIEYIYPQPCYYTSKSSGERTIKYYNVKKIGHMCSGVRGIVKGVDGVRGKDPGVKNVSCRQIYPTPEDVSWDKKWWEKKRLWDKRY